MLILPIPAITCCPSLIPDKAEVQGRTSDQCSVAVDLSALYYSKEADAACKQRRADHFCEGMCLLLWMAVRLLSWTASISMTDASAMHCM